jgi:hypothetical protein
VWEIFCVAAVCFNHCRVSFLAVGRFVCRGVQTVFAHKFY